MPITKSYDGTPIHFETSGSGPTALVFVHGWIGNGTWWDQQKNAFPGHQIVQMDLGGHGKSGKDRKHYTVQTYAEDIATVVNASGAKKVVLVGHSMSGSHVTQAYTLIPEKVERLIFVDTLQDLDRMPTMKEVGGLFAGLKADYVGTVKSAFRNYMFSAQSPEAVVNRITGEALEVKPEHSANLLQNFYEVDIRPAASKVTVPVRAIQSGLLPTNASANRKYFTDYSFETIEGVGHYPMLEKPDAFNAALKRALST